MRIVVNDHSGHAFPIQLSRQLAQLGHTVLHAYSTSFQSPKGDFDRAGPERLQLLPISNRRSFEKYSILKRRRQEREYAAQLVQRMKVFMPDVVLSGTTPLFVQEYVLRYCQRAGVKFVYWCQDIYTVAIRQIAARKVGVLGFPLWYYFKWLESSLLKKSHHIVSITEDFNTIFNDWRIDPTQVTCIPNWAPIAELQPVAKQNNWAEAHALTDKFCIVYAGTLGLKHNPGILVQAARHFRQHKEVVFLVISEGLGADYLKAQKEAHQLDNLLLLPFQAFSDMNNVLGTADILLAILEPAAGVFSVPSKVLTYLCAAKPIVLAMPPGNLSAGIVQRNKAGYCVDPTDAPGFCRHIETLIGNAALRREMGDNARAYAEEHFEIAQISKRFLQVFQHTLSPLSKTYPTRSMTNST